MTGRKKTNESKFQKFKLCMPCLSSFSNCAMTEFTRANTLQSFLSPSLQYLLVDSRMKYHTQACTNYCVTSSLTFKWDAVSSCVKELLAGCNDEENENLNHKYSTACQNLWSIFVECGIQVERCQKPPLKFWQWTGCEEQILLCFNYLQLERSSPVMPVKVSLLLTSIFENSIGNVYQLKKQPVPFLLRDLLISSELKNIFGEVPILVAHVILGTPLGFNIRNICWHGFVSPNEIHRDIAGALMVLITSFGQRLLEAGVFTVACRTKMGKEAWSTFLVPLQNMKFPELNESINEVLAVIESCNFIPKPHKLYWTSSLECFTERKYGESLLILLPALEHMLRCIFCCVNNCQDRVLVAEQHTFYTTLDEILSQFISRNHEVKEENRLSDMLGKRVMEMLMDFFDSHAGPRIRDKMSHGECNFEDIPAKAVNHIFVVSMLILMKFQDFRKLKLKTCLESAEENYSAKFHSITLLKTQARAISKILDDWHYFSECQTSPEVLQLQSTVQNYSSQFFTFSEDDVSRRIEFFLNLPIFTLYRSKPEMIIINSLQKISAAIENVCRNCTSAVQTRQNLFDQHCLRSRQRLTYLRMMDFLPSLKVVLKSITFLVLLQLQCLPQIHINSRFIKNIQKYSETMASLSSCDKNKWLEMKEKTIAFCLQSISVL